jgi:predicted nucleic acid-binding protein
MILLDTNILVRLSDRADVNYKTTHNAIAGCWRKGRQLFVSDQGLQEYWVVATRTTSVNGLGMQAPRVDRFIEQFMQRFTHAPDPAGLFDQWHKLVYVNNVAGTRAYDARFAAFVHAGGFQGFMTYNLQHFKAFGITLVDPKDPSTW